MDNYTWNISVEKDISSALKNLILISVATASYVAVLMRATLGWHKHPCDVVYVGWPRTSYLLSVVVMTLVNQYDLQILLLAYYGW